MSFPNTNSTGVSRITRTSSFHRASFVNMSLPPTKLCHYRHSKINWCLIILLSKVPVKVLLWPAEKTQDRKREPVRKMSLSPRFVPKLKTASQTTLHPRKCIVCLSTSVFCSFPVYVNNHGNKHLSVVWIWGVNGWASVRNIFWINFWIFYIGLSPENKIFCFGFVILLDLNSDF